MGCLTNYIEAEKMQELQKEIEKSVRSIFRIFFGSRLYLKKENESPSNNHLGVDLLMKYHGNKRLSLYLESDTMRSVINRLVDDGNNNSNDKLAYEIMSEMASMIAGNAFEEDSQVVTFSNPIRSKEITSYPSNTLNFTSKLGKLAIAIEEV